jgi:hypothetical protein
MSERKRRDPCESGNADGVGVRPRRATATHRSGGDESLRVMAG